MLLAGVCFLERNLHLPPLPLLAVLSHVCLPSACLPALLCQAL